MTKGMDKLVKLHVKKAEVTSALAELAEDIRNLKVAMENMTDNGIVGCLVR